MKRNNNKLKKFSSDWNLNKDKTAFNSKGRNSYNNKNSQYEGSSSYRNNRRRKSLGNIPVGFEIKDNVVDNNIFNENGKTSKYRYRTSYDGRNFNKKTTMMGKNAVERLLQNIKKGFSDECVDEKIRDLFFYLVKESKYKEVENLLNLEKSFDIDVKNEEGKTALMVALDRISEEATKAELSRELYWIENKTILEEVEVELNEDELEENNKLVAENGVRQKKEKMVKCLLDRGASINKVDKNNNGVSWYVDKSGNKYIEDLFYKKRENKRNIIINNERRGEVLEPARRLLSQYERTEEEIFQKDLILKANNISLEDYVDSTKIELLVCRDDCTAQQLKQFINENDDEGHTVLSYLMAKNALKQGSLEVVRQIRDLIRAGADMYEVDFGGASILMHIVMAKDEEFMEELLEDEMVGDSLVYQSDYFGNDVLSYAAEFGNKNIFRRLVEYINSDYYITWELFMKAAKARNIDVLEYIIKNYIQDNRGEILKNLDKEDERGRTALMYLANTNDEIVNSLIEAGANIEKKDEDNIDMLMFASQSGNKAMCEYFIDKGISVYNEDIYGYTALTYAVRDNNLEVVKCLLENCAQINHKTRTGVTALMFAVLSTNKDIYRYLVDNGANINERNNNGKTALMYAAESGNRSALKYLIDNGADVDIRDKEGKTFVDYADIELCSYIQNELEVRIYERPKVEVPEIFEGCKNLFNGLSK